MTRRIWIIGSNLAGLITAIRLLPYGFRLHILEQIPAPEIHDQLDVLPPVWPGFFHATWTFLQELSLPSPLPPFRPGPVECASASGQRHPVWRIPFFSRLHILPELLLFGGLSWPDRLHLINTLEKDWETRRADETRPDNQRAETWDTVANQSATARHNFWDPLCRWLLGCDLSEASQHILVSVLTRYAQGRSSDTQWFFGTPSTLADLKIGIRMQLVRQGVQFHARTDYPSFQCHAGLQETVSLTGEAFSPSDAYVATLPPAEIIGLLPERALTKFAQLDQMAKIPSRTGSWFSLSLPKMQLGPALIFGSPGIDWAAISPSDPSRSSRTYLSCFIQNPPQATSLEPTRLIENTWDALQQILPLPSHLSLDVCKPELLPYSLRQFPAIAGARAFRPLNTSPIGNLFFAGPWTATSLPHSMESLVQSANACAEAIAHRFFSG